MKLLILDDDKITLDLYRSQLIDFDADYFDSSHQALESLHKKHYDILIADYKMPEMNGIDFFIEAKKHQPDYYTILLTGYPDKLIIENSFNSSLIDRILIKPVKSDQLISHLHHAFGSIEKKQSPLNDTFEETWYQIINTDPQYNPVIGLSDITAKIKLINETNFPLLISGDNGSGKESIALYIHQNRLNPQGTFIKINFREASSYNQIKALIRRGKHLKSSSIFSHIPASATYFFHHIENIDSELQEELLSIIDWIEHSNQKGNSIRIICSSDHRLNDLLEDKSFRSDLYYRLTRFTLTVPPLKDHKEHIPELIQTTIRTYCQTNRISEPAISPQLMDKLSGYHWPGNIRELKLVIQRALIHYETHGFFNESCFEPPFRKKNNQDMMDLYTFLCDEIITRRTDLKKIEKDIINMLIDKFDGDIITASKETGIFRDKFYRNRSSR